MGLSQNNVRVRFAPSPTGYLHIGNARTALFNYLFARKSRGAFILRIEDTDKERSRQEYEKALIEDLKWIGIDWDEGPDCGGNYGPYRQSQRLSIYKEAAEQLLSEGKAYKCYCTKEELAQRNEQAMSEGRNPGYDSRCRELTREQIAQYEKEERKPVLRFRVEPKMITVHDLIRDDVTFDGKTISDFVIMRPDGIPMFHFAVVLDDIMMKITHVIRGEDHLSNTPKHILLFESIGAAVPQFAHMSMTLGPDKARLSKRHGATSVRAYEENGYLSDAFFNYISLLGWGTTESQEFFSKQELIREFSLDRCHKSSAIFDPDKLLWMNGTYIRNKTVPELLNLSIPFLRQAGLIKDPLSPKTRSLLEKIISMEQEKLKTLKDVPDRASFFLQAPEYEEKACKKFLDEKGKDVLKQLVPALDNIESFNTENLENAIRNFCEKNEFKFGIVFHPLRVAVSGTTKGPGLFEMLEVLGKDTVLNRINAILK